MKLGKLSNKICVQCGKQAYEYKGKVYKLCAKCGMAALISLLDWEEDKSKSEKSQLDEIVGLDENN